MSQKLSIKNFAFFLSICSLTTISNAMLFEKHPGLNRGVVLSNKNNLTTNQRFTDRHLDQSDFAREELRLKEIISLFASQLETLDFAKQGCVPSNKNAFRYRDLYRQTISQAQRTLDDLVQQRAVIYEMASGLLYSQNISKEKYHLLFKEYDAI